MKILNEAKDLGAYKKLINLLGKYYDAFPGVSNKYLDMALENGLKIMPKDKRALAILVDIIDCKDESVPSKVQMLMNYRFSDVCKDYRPMYKESNKLVVAYWNREGKVYDQVIALLGLDGKGSTGHWSDQQGNKVSLVESGEEQK